MRGFRTILCPVDTSTFSQRALRHAVALGNWYDAEVVALFVRPAVLPAFWTGTRAAPSEMTEEHVRAADSLDGFVRSAVGTSPTRRMVTEGHVVQEILRVARDLSADLIVMGTHGLSGFDRLLLGSVTEKVLRRAECPVLTIPRLAQDATESPDVTFGTILCGVDRSSASRSALDAALVLAEQAGGRLILVHVLEDLSEEEPRFAFHFNTAECWRAIEPEIRATYEAMVPDAARLWCDIEVRTPRGKPYRELLKNAEESKADLIVLGTAGWHTPIAATTQHVLRAATCPVLAVPSEQILAPKPVLVLDASTAG